MVPNQTVSTRRICLGDGRLTRCRCEGVGRAEHDTSSLDSVKALPDHGDDGSGSHVLDQAWEERLSGEVGVICIYWC